MGCSNFCTSENLGQLTYSQGYVSRAEERAESERMQKAERMYQASVAASTAGADPVHGTIEQQVAGGVNIVTGLLAAAVLTAAISAPFQGLIEAVSTTIEASRASKM